VSGSAPFVLAAISAAPVDSASLMLHLEICRLQAELDLLESRIGDAQAAPGPPGEADVAAPFAHRAEELVERMVASLRHAGREEIEAASDRRRREAQAVLDDARRRAEDVVAGARAQLATALVERSHVVDGAFGVEIEQVLLSDREVPPRAAALVVEMPVQPTPPTVPPAVGPTHPVESRPQPRPAPPSLPQAQAHPVATAIEAEEARTDAAFEAWLAVAPTSGAAEPEPVVAVVAPVTEVRSRSRSRWLLPLEVLAALLATALVVVLVLVFVG
jgi:hypothetical protein